MSETCVRAAPTCSRRSGRRSLSPLPTTRSTPERAATSSGLVWAQHPFTAGVRPGLARAARRIICRSENWARAVTVQVLTTTTSAGSSKSTVLKPRASSMVWSTRVSTWLSRHPRVANETVRAAVNSAALAHARRRRRLPELAARGADVLALAPPDRGRDPGVEQDRLEAEDPGERRAGARGRPTVVEPGPGSLCLQAGQRA